MPRPAPPGDGCKHCLVCPPTTRQSPLFVTAWPHPCTTRRGAGSEPPRHKSPRNSRHIITHNYSKPQERFLRLKGNMKSAHQCAGGEIMRCGRENKSPKKPGHLPWAVRTPVERPPSFAKWQSAHDRTHHVHYA